MSQMIPPTSPQVGDTVQITGVVEGLGPPGLQYVKVGTWNVWVPTDKCTVITRAERPLKVGDRVRPTGPGPAAWFGEIRAIDDERAWVKYGEDHLTLRLSELRRA